jgi:hypothetical protein
MQVHRVGLLFHVRAISVAHSLPSNRAQVSLESERSAHHKLFFHLKTKVMGESPILLSPMFGTHQVVF